jgi:hypothetical protein
MNTFCRGSCQLRVQAMASFQGREGGESVLQQLVLLPGMPDPVLHEVEVEVGVDRGEVTPHEEGVPLPHKVAADLDGLGLGLVFGVVGHDVGVKTMATIRRLPR